MVITIAIPNYRNSEIIESIYACAKQEKIKQKSIEIIIIGDGRGNGINSSQLTQFNFFKGKIRLFICHHSILSMYHAEYARG